MGIFTGHAHQHSRTAIDQRRSCWCLHSALLTASASAGRALDRRGVASHRARSEPAARPAGRFSSAQQDAVQRRRGRRSRGGSAPAGARPHHFSRVRGAKRERPSASSQPRPAALCTSPAHGAVVGADTHGRHTACCHQIVATRTRLLAGGAPAGSGRRRHRSSRDATTTPTRARCVAVKGPLKG